MCQKIKLYDLISEYTKRKTEIYEVVQEEEENISKRKQIEISMGTTTEAETMIEISNKLVGTNFNLKITLYQSGILKRKEKFYYYSIEKDIEKTKKFFSKEEALKTEVYLREANVSKIMGENIFEVKDGDKINILNVDLENYFPESVEKIEYIFSWKEKEKKWKTLNYIVISKNKQRIYYKNSKKGLSEVEIKLPNIEFENILDISEDKDNIIIKNKGKVILYYQGKKVLEADKFIQRRNKFYFFEIKNKIKIFNEKGEIIRKKTKVISPLPNKLIEKIVVLEDTTSHKKNVLKFDDKFETFSLLNGKISLKKNNRIITLTKEGSVTVLNLEGKEATLRNVKSLSSIRYSKIQYLGKGNLELELLEISYKIERGKFNQHDNSKTIYKEENAKLYLINLKDKGFIGFVLKELEEGKFNIASEREKKKNYKNQKIDKIFLEKINNSYEGINLYFCMIYRYECIKNKNFIFYF